MPIYEYKCRQCGQTSEFRITSQSQVDALSCTACGSRELKRLMSVPAAITSSRTESYGQSCSGSNAGSSEPGRCCGHSMRD